MKAKDVMTHCLASIAPEAPIRDAIARMISHQVSGMPVIGADGKLVGIVTEGDFLRRAEMHTEAPRRRWLELLLGPGSDAAEYARSHGHTVRDVMSPNVVAVTKETPLSEVVQLMEEHAIKRIPVVDDGRVAGIVSRADLMSALGEYLIKPKKELPASDESISRTIMTEMKRQPWCPVQSLKIRVRKGFVDRVHSRNSQRRAKREGEREAHKFVGALSRRTNAFPERGVTPHSGDIGCLPAVQLTRRGTNDTPRHGCGGHARSKIRQLSRVYPDSPVRTGGLV